MADDSDVPPLEDMTEVLKKADAIRESRNGPSQQNGTAKPEKVAGKEKAKVKKNPTARAVAPSQLSQGHEKETQQPVEEKSVEPKPATKPSGNGMFGGMKKGFLFGGPAKPKAANNPTKQAVKESSKSRKEDIPFISPKNEKSQSGLTFDEVQQAMSEAKGLLDNQDWITDDLLTKIEKNESLRKNFADPTFMQALEEFQKSPEAAMAKYKGNQEVEKFLQEFCGLLGDHFTNLGSSSESPNPAKPTPSNGNPRTSSQQPASSPAPKITEITGKIPNKPKSTPKIVELTDEENTPTTKPASAKSKQPAKIVELSDSDSATASMSKLNISGSSTQQKSGGHVPNIMTYTPGAGADIQEVSSTPAMADDEVREVLNDPKVMETLMDPQVMNIIQLLRSDPEKAQRIVDTATGELKEKITLLILKGLLRFQAS